MAIDANRDPPVTAPLPARIGIRHHVAIDAGLRLIRQIRGRIGDAGQHQRHANRHPHKPINPDLHHPRQPGQRDYRYDPIDDIHAANSTVPHPVPQARRMRFFPMANAESPDPMADSVRW